jgi:hypothetical protein
MRRKTIVSDGDLIRDLKGRHLVEPPRRSLAEAIALGGNMVARRTGAVAWLAELLFDSGLAPATAGVRKGAAASERRLLYRCRTAAEDEVQLDLRCRSLADGTMEIVGQLLPPWRDASVEVRSGQARRRTALGVNGEFALDGVSGGKDTIVVAIHAEDGSSVVLERVPMPARKGRPASR